MNPPSYIRQRDIHAVSIVCWWDWMRWKGPQMLKQLFTHVNSFWPFFFAFVHPLFLVPLEIRVRLTARMLKSTFWAYRWNYTDPSINRVSPTMTYGMYFNIPVNYFLTDYVLIPNKAPEHRSNSVLLTLIISGWQDSGKAKLASSRWKEELELLVCCFFSSASVNTYLIV